MLAKRHKVTLKKPPRLQGHRARREADLRLLGKGRQRTPLSQLGLLRREKRLGQHNKSKALQVLAVHRRARLRQHQPGRNSEQSQDHAIDRDHMPRVC